MSLRARLTILLTCGIGLPFLVGAILLEVLVPSWLQDGFDDGLETRAAALTSMIVQTDGELELEFSDRFMPEFEDDEEPCYFEVWSDREHLLERSRSFHPQRDVRRPDLARASDVSDEPRFTDVVLPDGRPGRQVQLDFVPEVAETEADDEDDAEEEPFEVDEPTPPPTAVLASGGTVGTVLVAGNTEELRAQIAQVRVVTAVATVLVLLLLAAIVHFTLRVGLRPVEGVVAQVAGMNAESLGERIDASGAPAELLPLLHQLNAFIERLSLAFVRERQLTADMAHELKTPIAELKSLSEVGERWPDDREAVIAFFSDAQSVASQMERVVVHLLALARHDAGQQAVRPETVDVVGLIESSWRPYARDASERGLELRMDAPAGLRVTSDGEMLGLVLANLFSNAVAYSRPDSAITCAATRRQGGILLSVTNDASDLEPGDLDVMFDRFWRKDQARAGGSSAGLGLSLVKAFAALLRAEVSVSLGPDRRFRVEVAVPDLDLEAGESRGEERTERAS